MMLRYAFQECIEFLDEGSDLPKIGMIGYVERRMICLHLDNRRRKSETMGEGLAEAI